ncbi:hypothetical protein KGF54_004814 [Candida jiufengensis]|uniref:uncharacterized protein n=1 Tax=Candida jiufengensis TaxID=497108 RepID=UPI002224B350|nr:uncharacterized protein KGF54_004814 [Candida jiufengensis]KAI5951739.1 hypothetical protein KGF54_004814 [Candida jiufengensis]
MDKIQSFIDQRVPIKYINIEDDIISYDNQLELVKLINSHIDQNAYYFKNLLSKYIKKLELSNEELSDEVYDLFVDPKILNAKELSPDTPDIIKYHVNGFTSIAKDDSNKVIIKETPRLISGNNTTGLRTWEAALYLSNCLNDQNILQHIIPFGLENKTILELGCGTGLLSLSLAKIHHKTRPLKKIIMTDGSMTVFDNVQEVLKLNDLESDNLIHCQQLIWGEELTIKSKIDVVIAADITYDSRILRPLCQTIAELFQYKDLKLALIAATVRNIDTINCWEEELNNWFPNRWETTKSEKDPGSMKSMCFFSPNTPEIRIYSIEI